MIKESMCIYAVPDPKQKEGFKLELVAPHRKWWMNDSDVMVGVTTVSYEPPEDMSREDLAIKAVETLRDRQKQAMAEAQMKYDKLQVRINELLMITHQSSGGTAFSNEDSYSNVIDITTFNEDEFNDLPF